MLGRDVPPIPNPREVAVPLRVTCPSCGRVGKGPDHAIGRIVRCPACSYQHTLTADMLLPEDQQLRDDERSQSERPSAPAVKPKAQPKAGSGGHIYDLDETAFEPPKRPVKPIPAVPVRDERADRDQPGGLSLSIPVLVGGALCVALLSILGAWGAVRIFRGPAAVGEAAAASNPAPNPSATEVAVAPAPAGETTQPSTPGGSPAATAPAPAVGYTPVPVGAGEADSGMVSVAVAMQTSDDPAPEPAPEPVGESDVAARARIGAADVASRDDGAGKALSTADIVAESEPSVALIKGNGSSGTGFLVGPGLVATNAHVIDDELIPELEVRFVSADENHNAPLKAELLYEDPERDLAFLAVKTDLKPLRVAKAYTFRKGEDITVIGNPGLGDGQVLENAISRGVMSTKTQIEGRNFYQLGIAINPGNSGGPVFDSSGRVIGVATLKASKQESTGFSIPIEDLQAALAKLAKQSTSDADRYRSRHRIVAATKALGGGGALMCLVIDLRRADAVGNNAAVKDILGKLETVTAELDKEMFPALTTQAARIKNDPLIAAPVKKMIGEMNENFAQIRGAYSSRKNVDDNQLRPWKQTHKRLITDLSASLKLEVPAGLMVAFDDHAPSQPTIITMGPQSLGSFNSRLRPRSPGALGGPRTPGGISRPPTLRDRTGRRTGPR
jgi:S1-C subfamily serine protease